MTSKIYVVKRPLSILYVGQNRDKAVKAMQLVPKGVAVCDIWKNDEYVQTIFSPDKI